MELMANISSLAQHVNLAIAMHWKSAATDAHVLPEFWAEKILMENQLSRKSSPKQEVEDSMTEAARLARAACDNAFKVSDGKDGSAILQAMRPKSVGFLATDVDWQCEMVLMEAVCGADSGLRLRSQILDRLPSSTEQPTAEECLQMMHSLKDSDSYRMATAGAQALVNVTSKWLGRIADERAPEFADSMHDEALKPIIDRFAYFVKYEKSSGSKGESVSVFGLEAVKGLWNKAKTTHEDRGCTNEDVKELRIFSYLIPTAEAEEFESLLKDVEKGTNAIADASASKAKKKKGAQKHPDAAVAEAMALFK
jgi:hypothetical protein